MSDTERLPIRLSAIYHCLDDHRHSKPPRPDESHRPPMKCLLAFTIEDQMELLSVAERILSNELLWHEGANEIVSIAMAYDSEQFCLDDEIWELVGIIDQWSESQFGEHNLYSPTLLEQKIGFQKSVEQECPQMVKEIAAKIIAFLQCKRKN